MLNDLQLVNSSEEFVRSRSRLHNTARKPGNIVFSAIGERYCISVLSATKLFVAFFDSELSVSCLPFITVIASAFVFPIQSPEYEDC